jgi:hypothetical protein
MAKSIDAKLKNIGVSVGEHASLFGREGSFIIPPYQRAYKWEYKKQCDKLWQDVERFIDDPNVNYFFGSIIINSENSKEVEKQYVIDGQQRLTTFMLLLKALLIKINAILLTIPDDEDSEDLKEALTNRREDIIKCLYQVDADKVRFVARGKIPLDDLPIKYDNLSINEEYPNEIKIILYGKTFDDIERGVTKIPRKQKDNKYTNFFKNFRFFYEKLGDLGESKINSFAKSLLEKCQIIEVVSYDTEEAIEIFNSLNSTGMPLANADIISAQLYARCKDDSNKENAFKVSWSKIVEATNALSSQMNIGIDDIFNQYMYILRAQNNEYSTTLPGVRSYFIDKHPELIAKPEDFIKAIQQIVGFWKEKAYTAKLETLKLLLLKHNSNSKLFYATYFSIKSDEDNDKKQAFLEGLLKLFALLSVTPYGYSSARFKVFLIGLNMKIGAGVSTDDLVTEMNEHIHNVFVKSEVEQLLLESYPKTETIYLNEYLFAKETEATVDFDADKIEIEHIMPASGKDSEGIRNDANMDEDEFDILVNTLGNKILLEKSINATLGNGWFKIKKQTSVNNKKGYKNSVFPLALSLTEYSSDFWTKDDIEKATGKAARRIVDFIFGNEE